MKKKAADLLPRFLERTAGLPLDAPAVVGVSGGMDSVVLLDLLRRAGFSRLVVAHFHHGLRGRAADEDARFVESLAQKNAMAFVAGRGKTRARAAGKHESIEEAARKLRRAFFRRAARKHGAALIFLAHHANDAAETVLFHLARGSGLRGMGSLRESSPLEGSSAEIARPLLGFTRREIESYANSHRLEFRHDESNFSRCHTRNRIRHDVLPALAGAVGFDPVPCMARAAAILADEDDWSEMQVAETAAHSRLELRGLRALHIAHQRRLLRAWLRIHTGRDTDFATIERARALAASGAAPAKINLPGGRHLRRRAGRLFIEGPAARRPRG
ncbi:MAG: tRNA lysidine(34) synthetase TilS [Chthoniobacterales bacterium]|nr:tRNA lysidine(34) synthetase TilS [Chthoniobacterales bacterium]